VLGQRRLLQRHGGLAKPVGKGNTITLIEPDGFFQNLRKDFVGEVYKAHSSCSRRVGEEDQGREDSESSGSEAVDERTVADKGRERVKRTSRLGDTRGMLTGALDFL
jgi:hypothetical protein